MKLRRIAGNTAAVLFALALTFTVIPALTGSLSVNAESLPDVGYVKNDIKGCIGGFHYWASSTDSDSPKSPVRVDVYLDSTLVATHQTGEYGSFHGFAKSSAIGEHTVGFKVYDIDSSGMQTGKTHTYKPVTVDIRPASSFTESEIEISTANCKEINGLVPKSAGTSLYISTSKDGGYDYRGLNDGYWDFQTFYVTDKEFLSGTVYAKVTVYDGNDSKTIIKEIKVEDHTFDSGKVTTPAKCFTKGEKVLTCSRCGDTVTKKIPEIGHHSWNSGTVTKPAKYFTKGEKTYKCKTCGAKKTTVIPKLDIAKVTPAKAKIKSATVRGKKLTLKWKRIAKKTKGYQIGIKDKKSRMTRYVIVKQKSRSTMSKTIKLEKGRKYAVKVRAYNVVEGRKVYGPWSTAKSGRV